MNYLCKWQYCVSYTVLIQYPAASSDGLVIKSLSTLRRSLTLTAVGINTLSFVKQLRVTTSGQLVLQLEACRRYRRDRTSSRSAWPYICKRSATTIHYSFKHIKFNYSSIEVIFIKINRYFFISPITKT